MKTTLTILFVIAINISSAQTLRHIYVKWIKPNYSFLYELYEIKGDTEKNIFETKTLGELINLYRDAHKIVSTFKPTATENKKSIKFIEKANKVRIAHRSMQKIESEIKVRDFYKNQLFDLCFYWTCSIFSIFLGILVFKKINKWLGVSGIIAGFSGMLYWTNPFHISPLFGIYSYGNHALNSQFEHLLNFRITFSVITWILLITLWLLIDKKTYSFKND